MKRVVGGLIGLATSSQNGLMSQLAYSSTGVYSAGSYQLYKLFTFDTDWDRKFAAIEYGIGEQNCYAMVSAYNRPSGKLYKLHKTFNVETALKLYYKDNDVYLFCNQNGSFAKCFIRSTDVVTLVRQGSDDMSGYTEITS